ncbi:MAG: hypothetical protein M3081_19460 [Gemmatimonadota bacterium]|nr:hypothetical protein [Gemmatimonadota bacterium]
MPQSLTPTRFRASVWWILSAIVLLAGYVDLWRGGETVAPILLVLGYCVLIPVAIVARGPDAGNSRDSRSAGTS